MCSPHHEFELLMYDTKTPASQPKQGRPTLPERHVRTVSGQRLLEERRRILVPQCEVEVARPSRGQRDIRGTAVLGPQLGCFHEASSNPMTPLISLDHDLLHPADGPVCEKGQVVAGQKVADQDVISNRNDQKRLGVRHKVGEGRVEGTALGREGRREVARKGPDSVGIRQPCWSNQRLIS